MLRFVRVRSRSCRFAADESGGALILGLFLIVAMALAVGTGFDTMRYEVERAKTQHAIDTAVLAAASLSQDRDPQAVAEDIFRRHGLDPSRVQLTISEGVNSKSVQAVTTVNVPTYFLKMAGNPTLSGPAVSTAVENATDIEIVMVLDNSGSMGWNGNFRLNLLKTAAKEFIDTVVQEDTRGTVALAIVPFATQVAAGPRLTEYFNVSDEHAYSHCVDFAANDFNSVGIDTAQPLQRTGHFDIFTWSDTIRTENVVCPFDSAREITLWSNDRAYLKSRIDDMWAGGNTSIDVGTKWGTTLLDPSTRPLLDDLIDNGEASFELSGMPFDYNRSATKKYLIVMSDGQNTDQFYLNAPFRSGPSTLWRGSLTCSISQPGCEAGLFHRIGASDQYYDIAAGNRVTLAGGLTDGENLVWPEATNEMSVARYARDVRAAAEGGAWQSYYNAMFSAVPANQKNTRTSQICRAARDRGVTVFTVGMDTYGQGGATLRDCASEDALFFEVEARDIGDAFSAIARQINQLRLTQ